MRISVYNDGDLPLRVVIDGDRDSVSILEVGDERLLESLADGVIELREGSQEDDELSGSATDSDALSGG